MIPSRLRIFVAEWCAFVDAKSIALCLCDAVGEPGLAAVSLAARALRLGGAAAAELDALAIDYTGIRFWSALLDRYLGRARVELGAEAADAAWQEGRRMEFESAISEALADGT